MDSPAARLKIAREAAGFPSAMKAAKHHRWGTSTYAAHENGQNGFDPETALKYAKAFKTSASWLLTAEGDAPRKVPLVRSYDPDAPERPDLDGPAGQQVEMQDGDIPELVGKGGLGSGQVIVTQEMGEMQARDEIKEEYWRFPSHFVRHVIGAQAANLIAVECQGDSMSPTLGSGERVWVDRSQNLLSPEGIYAIRDPHEAIQIKRLQYTDDSPRRIAVISDNPMHPTRVFNVRDVSIVGRVVCVMRVL